MLKVHTYALRETKAIVIEYKSSFFYKYRDLFDILHIPVIVPFSSC
jgi:hypothetical protein